MPPADPSGGGPVRVTVAADADPGARHLQDLADAALRLTTATSVADVLEVAGEAARTIVGVHQAVASRLGHSWSDSPSYVSLSERYAEYRDYAVAPQGLGVLNFVTRENLPLRLTGEQLAAHPEYRGLRDAPGHPPLPNYLAVPLVGRDGSNLGLIQVSHRLDDGEFGPEHEALLVGLAQMASSSIETIELIERERAAREAAEALQRVGSAITARLELREIVQIATDAARELVPAAFGAFFYNVVDDGGESYTLYTLSGVEREAFAGFPMPRNTKVFGPTFAGEGIVRVDDITADARYGQNPPYKGMPPGHLPVRSYLAVPVVTSDGEVAGGLFFGHPEPGVFGERDEQMVSGIAAQSAIAIENARLYSERARTAQTLQHALLPPDLPQLPGIEIATRYRAAGEGNEVGGDFYDAFELSDGAWAIVVGDVCGKGPKAATVTALARYSLRAHAVAERCPGRLLELLNDALLRQRAPGFCTVALARVEPGPEGTRVQLCCAGHPLGVVVRRGGETESLGSVGTPLGVLETPVLPVEETTLLTGDLLLLYTDGVTDAAAPERMLTGDDVAALAAEAAGGGASAVAEHVERSAVADAGGSPRDDMALLALRLADAGGGTEETIHAFAADARAAGAVADVLEPLESRLGPELSHDARLLATELVANAVRHAGTSDDSIELRIRIGADTLRISVLDDGAGFTPPERPVPPPSGPGRWGYYLVDQRAERWGVETNGRTHVWVELPIR